MASSTLKLPTGGLRRENTPQPASQSARPVLPASPRHRSESTVVCRPGRLIRTRASALLLAVLSGCGTDAPDDATSRDRESSPGQGGHLNLELIHLSPPSLELSHVESIDLDSRGRVYVVDRLLPGVTVLSPSLNPLRAVGRVGDGPGEFRQRQIQLLDGDSLAVFDSDLGRVTVFDPDSFAVVRTFRPTGFANQIPRRYWTIGENRSLAVMRRAFHARETGEADAERYDVVMTSTLGATEADTLLIMPSAEVLVARAPGFVSVGNHPYGLEPLIRPLDSSRIAYAHTGEARFWVLGVSGDTISSGSAPTEPVAVPPRQLEEEIAENWDGPLADALRSGAPYQWPVIVGLAPVVGAQPTEIWMSVRGPADAGRWPVFVFDANGRHAATSSLPAGEVLRAVRDDVALTTSTDSLDIPWIHSYRVARSPRR